MKLPLLLSVPHAGLVIPPEAKPYCRLTAEETIKDGDEGAAEIYALREHVAGFVTTDIARAIIDLNRAEDDRRADGVVKTHTCWNVPVYEDFPPSDVVETLLQRYHRPYHAKLRELPGDKIQLCIDCHTMAAKGPPIGPGAGVERPAVCLGDVNGSTLPAGWMSRLADAFGAAFEQPIAINQPFAGGYITKTHGAQRPWVQVELSRGDFLTNAEKRRRVLQALERFCGEVFDESP